MAETAVAQTESQDGLLSVTELVQMFEASEEATISPRANAERDRDYYDNIQLTADELKTLNKRGQPPYMDNVIKTKIDFLIGLEKQQGTNPKALPRTPVHEADADGASEALRYVTDEQSYQTKRSGVWKNLLIEGAAGFAVAIKPKRYGNQRVTMMGGSAMGGQPPVEYCVEIRRIAWDRMFYDPHASEPDFSDASYLGVVVWMDYDEALAKYGDEAKEALDATMSSVAHSDTYDDKPKFRVWADKKRKRVRVVQIWVRRDEQWYFAEFTKGGILKAGPSPYVNDQGESDCELFFQSAYVDRENNRYGLVREMIYLQDALNKRHSKALHLLNTSQTVYEDGAVDNIETFRRESVKPDGTMKVNPGALSEKRIEFRTRTDLAVTQFELLNDNRRSLDTKGPNATMLGESAGSSSSASGKAIIASQQGGMIQLGDLLDNLRHLDKRVFTAVWNRIRQFWTEEKWLRVTDDERNVKWVGVNVDRQQLQEAMAQNPQMQEKIAGAVQNVAELDCDIIIDQAPDSLTPQLEQFQAIVGLKQYDANNELPFRALIVAAPNLKDKDKILAEMDKAKQPDESAQQKQQAAEELEFRHAAAKVADVEAGAELKRANAFKTVREANTPAEQPMQPAEQPDPFAQEQALADIENTVADTALKRANTARTAAQTEQARQSTALAPLEFAARRNESAQRMNSRPAPRAA